MTETPLAKENKSSDKARELLSNAYKHYTDMQLEESESLYNEAKTFAEETKQQDCLCKAYLGLAKISMHRGEFDLVVKNTNNAIQIASSIGNKHEEAASHNLLGIALFNLGDISNALINYFSGLKLSQQIENKKLESQFLNNISNGYHWMKEYENALQYSQMAMNLALEVGNESDICSMKSNHGLLYTGMGRFDEAFKYLNESLEMNLKSVNNPDSLAKNYNNLASAYLAQENYEEALKNYSKSMEIVVKHNDQSTIANTDMLIGNAYYKMGEFAKAVEHHEKALELAEKINSKRLQNEINKNLSDAYEAIGEYEKSYKCFTAYYELETQATKEFSDLKVKYLNIAHQVDIAKKEAEILQNKNEELDSLNNKLIALNEEKNEFLGIAVHDLKNPLNSILLAVSNLIRSFDKISGDKFNSTIAKINATVDRMKLIIDNLLDVNSIESGTYNLNFQEVNISLLTAEIVSHFKNAAAEKNISLEHESSSDEIVFVTDANAFTEILENLISNAIKYSPPGKKVKIILTSLGKVNFKIDIVDSGLGIREDEKEKVFTKFSKISNKPTAGESSTGLGLSIVKKLTELLLGKISFESEYGKGSTFTLEF